MSKVSVRRIGSQGYGMLLVELGLPSGGEINRETLAQLLTAGTISRYEIQRDRIIVYVWPTSAEATKVKYRFTLRFAVSAKAAPATLYDFYNRDERVTLAPQSFLIGKP